MVCSRLAVSMVQCCHRKSSINVWAEKQYRNARNPSRASVNQRNLLVFIHSRNAPVITLVKFGLGQGLEEWNGPLSQISIVNIKFSRTKGSRSLMQATRVQRCNECGGRNIWHMFIRKRNNLHCQCRGSTVVIVRLCSKMVLENECRCDLISLVIELINV